MTDQEPVADALVAYLIQRELAVIAATVERCRPLSSDEGDKVRRSLTFDNWLSSPETESRKRSIDGAAAVRIADLFDGQRSKVAIDPYAVRAVRLRLGQDQHVYAHRVGWSQAYQSRLEREVAIVSIGTALRAGVLDRSVLVPRWQARRQMKRLIRGSVVHRATGWPPWAAYDAVDGKRVLDADLVHGIIVSLIGSMAKTTGLRMSG